MSSAKLIFLSCAHEDESLRVSLEKHLSPLERAGKAIIWHGGKVPPGDDSAHAIETQLRAADVVLLLVTANFLASETVHDEQLRPALLRRERDGVRVVPILAKPCAWQTSPLATLELLPRNRTPITLWLHPDEAWAEVVDCLSGVLAQAPDHSQLFVTPESEATAKLQGTLQQAADVKMSGNAGQVAPASCPVQGPTTSGKVWDIFISHAAEDKPTVVRPLAEILRKAGVRVWLDEHELQVGDSLTERIDEGLSRSRYGVVVLSHAFFAKHWPRKELAGLRAREDQGQKIVLPIWHNVDKALVAQFSPILADVLAARTDQGIDKVAVSLLGVIFGSKTESSSGWHPSAGRRFIELLDSMPDKTRLVDFLQFHLSLLDRYYYIWGGSLILEHHEFDGVGFDAHAPYAGHGCRLTLVTFTDVWLDPFDVTQESDAGIEICNELRCTIATIKALRERFRNDRHAQVHLREHLFRHHASWRLEFHETDDMPNLNFVVFAGRRSRIDATTARHDTWSRLLMENSSIVLKSYDYLLDAFLDLKSMHQGA